MKMNHFVSYVIATLFAIAMISCAGPSSSDADSDEIPKIEVTEEDNAEDNDFLYALPSPLQIASIFRRSGLIYIPDMTNNPDKVSNYNTKLIQKLNFGVYAADLAYSALNDKNQECIDYVKALSQLSESLWMTNVFSSVSILDRFEENLGNPDSLGYIIADFQMELDSYLEENGLSANSLVIFSGAWIESMHLAFKSLEGNPNPKLFGRIVEQRKIADNLIEILKKEDDDAELNMLIAHLEKISNHFASFNLDNIEEIEELESLTMSEEDINSAIADIDEARNFIING